MKNIDIIGIGVNGDSCITMESVNLIKNANYIIGAKRMVESILSLNDKVEHNYEILPDKIINLINTTNHQSIVVVMSGDTGFHSGATKLYQLLTENNISTNSTIKIHAGVSSIQYMASKINRPWQDVFLTSAHGIDCNFTGHVLANRECFFLVGGKITANTLVNSLSENFDNLTIYIGENLGYPDEKVTMIENLDSNLDVEISSLAVVWVVRPEYYIDNYHGMISDDDFIRGKVPITKSPIRNHAVSLIGRNQANLVIYDVGAGTGSIAIELALSNPNSTIYAFEINPEAIDLINQNIKKFQAYNIILITGNAPDSFKDIPAPDKVFIGGTKGNMLEIFDSILSKNPKCFITLSAIAIETFSTAVEIFQQKNIPNFNVTQLAVSNTKSVGKYNMLIAQNPTFLLYGGGQD